MSRNIFISFLGVYPYDEVKYQIKDKNSETILKTHFVQEAVLRHHYKKWIKSNNENKAVIFLTKEARQSNWVSPAQTGDKKGPYQGLENCLNNIGPELKVVSKNIPGGFSEEEIWEIFQIVFDELQQDDNVYFDMTNAFRSIPMLAMVLIDYAKFLKGITVASITYGAFEKDKEIIPVLDMQNFSHLQDWTSGVNQLVNNGNSNLIFKLIDKELVNTNEENYKNALKKLNRSLQELTESLTTVNGREIYNGAVFEKINRSIEEMSQYNEIKQLDPVIKEIKTKISKFEEAPSIHNGVEAIEWCRSHNLIQQVITLGIEQIISELCYIFGYNFKNYAHREFIRMTIWKINGKKRNRRVDQNKVNFIESEFNRIKDDRIFKDIWENYQEFSHLRNTINHAQITRSHENKGKSLIQSFNQYNKDLCEIINKRIDKSSAQSREQVKMNYNSIVQFFNK